MPATSSRRKKRPHELISFPFSSDRAAMFNSGQSCCGIERVYVHESLYDQFVEEVVKVVKVRTRSPLCSSFGIRFGPVARGKDSD